MTREEAIKELRGFIGQLTEGCQEAIKVLIPELKESEDERIRKAILSFIRHSPDTRKLTTKEYSKWIEYLDKQQDQKSISAEAVLVKAGLKPYKDGDQWCVLAGDNIQELKESEDERIRKDVLAFIKREGQHIDKYKWPKWIAWLEKQKAAETPQWMIDFLNDIRTASINKEGYDDYDGRREYEGKILAIIRWLAGNFIQQKEPNNRYAGLEITNVVRQALIECEAYRNFRPDVYAARVGATVETLVQKEQKPVEFFDEYKIIKKHITEDMLSSEVNKRLTECGWYVTDEKPVEWNEEDENKLNHILEIVHIASGSEVSVDEKEELESFLKSLRPQPKAKLTLLDENIIKAAVAFIEQNDHFNYWGGIDKHTVIKALRSLKSHWKPSEEQMEALERAATNEYLSAKQFDILVSLYEQLKKLM